MRTRVPYIQLDDDVRTPPGTHGVYELTVVGWIEGFAGLRCRAVALHLTAQSTHEVEGLYVWRGYARATLPPSQLLRRRMLRNGRGVTTCERIDNRNRKTIKATCL